MEKVTISTTYEVKRWLTDCICETPCGRFINVFLGKEIKTHLRGNFKAITINKKSILVKDLKTYIRDEALPF